MKQLEELNEKKLTLERRNSMKFRFIMHASKDACHVYWLQIHVMTRELIQLGWHLLTIFH